VTALGCAPASSACAVKVGVESAVSAPAAGDRIAAVGTGITGGLTGGVTGLAGGGVTFTGGLTTGARLIVNVEALLAPRLPALSSWLAFAV
jgi:hypothetical protein